MSEENGSTSTVLVHLDNAAEKMGRAMEEYVNGKIDESELERRVNEAVPRLESLGCEVGDETTPTRVNLKSVPENAQAAVYFYTEEDGTLRATAQLFQYGNGEEVDDTQHIEPGELAALEVIRLINMEHQSIFERVMLSMAFQKMQEQAGEGGPVDEDDPLASIEDEDTRAQVRKFMKH